MSLVSEEFMAEPKQHSKHGVSLAPMVKELFNHIGPFNSDLIVDLTLQFSIVCLLVVVFIENLVDDS